MYIIKRLFKAKHNSEWLKANMEAIEAMANQSSNIRYSLSIDDFDMFDEEKEKIKEPTFSEKLLQLISEKGMTNQQFYKAAFIDRKLFSAMKNDIDYKPKKETAVACCFGLKLTLAEAEKLISTAGYSLSKSIKWDSVVYYCLSKGIYDLFDVNELLDYAGEKCIRA